MINTNKKTDAKVREHVAIEETIMENPEGQAETAQTTATGLEEQEQIVQDMATPEQCVCLARETWKEITAAATAAGLKQAGAWLMNTENLPGVPEFKTEARYVDVLLEILKTPSLSQADRLAYTSELHRIMDRERSDQKAQSSRQRRRTGLGLAVTFVGNFIQELL